MGYASGSRQRREGGKLFFLLVHLSEVMPRKSGNPTTTTLEPKWLEPKWLRLANNETRRAGIDYDGVPDYIFFSIRFRTLFRIRLEYLINFEYPKNCKIYFFLRHATLRPGRTVGQPGDRGGPAHGKQPQVLVLWSVSPGPVSPTQQRAV